MFAEVSEVTEVLNGEVLGGQIATMVFGLCGSWGSSNRAAVLGVAATEPLSLACRRGARCLHVTTAGIPLQRSGWIGRSKGPGNVKTLLIEYRTLNLKLHSLRKVLALHTRMSEFPVKHR